MGRTPRTTYLSSVLGLLWPGIGQLWHDGAWSALALAIGFGLLLDLLLVVTFVWVELLSTPLLTVGWLALGVIWLLSLTTVRRVAQEAAETPCGEPGEDLFRSAQSEYLRGNWFQAEAVLLRMLERNPRDVEARLLLATLLRHTRRTKESKEQLSTLARFEDADRWSVEIEREREYASQTQPPLKEWIAAEKPAAGQAVAVAKHAVAKQLAA